MKELPDGRIRYYEQEKAASKFGEMRGSGFVTEYNPTNGNVRFWLETRDHSGNVKIVHMKNINGIDVNVPHYPHVARDYIDFGEK